MEQAFAYYICQGTTGPNFDISPYHNKRRLILMHHPYLSPAKKNTRHQRPIPTQSIPLNHASHKPAHIKNQKTPKHTHTLLPPTSNLPWASNPTLTTLPPQPPLHQESPPPPQPAIDPATPPPLPDRPIGWILLPHSPSLLLLPLPLPLPPPPPLLHPPKPPRVPNQPRQTMRQQEPERQHRDDGAETGPLVRRRGWVRGGRGGGLEEGGEEGDGDGEEGEAEGAVEEEEVGVGCCCCWGGCLGRWRGCLGRWRGHWLWMSEKGVGETVG